MQFIATAEHYRKALEITQGWKLSTDPMDDPDGEVLKDYEACCFIAIAAQDAGINASVDEDGITIEDHTWYHSIGSQKLMRFFDTDHEKVYRSDDPEGAIAGIMKNVEIYISFPVEIYFWDDEENEKTVMVDDADFSEEV